MVDDMNYPILTIVVAILLALMSFWIPTHAAGLTAPDHCPTLPDTYENVTEQWFVHLREYPTTERSITAFYRFTKYRIQDKFFYLDGVLHRTVKPIHDDGSRLVYSGWYDGADGFPHPRCAYI